MAFTAKITSITMKTNAIEVGVTYNDSATNFTVDEMMSFPNDGTTTQTTVTTAITTIGTKYKNNLAVNNTLQSKIGSVITI